MAEGQTIVRFAVSGQPRGWQRAGQRIVTTRAGQQFISNFTQGKTRSEEAAIKWFASVAMQGRGPVEGPLELRLRAYMAIPASWSKKKQAAALSGEIFPTGTPDLDNLTKLVGDSLNGLVYRDDAQIVTAAVWKRYSDKPRIVVEVLKHAAQRPAAPTGVMADAPLLTEVA